MFISTKGEKSTYSSRLLNLKNWNRIHFLRISHILPRLFPNKLANSEWTEPTFLQTPWILQMFHCNCEYSWKTRETSKKSIPLIVQYLLWFENKTSWKTYLLNIHLNQSLMNFLYRIIPSWVLSFFLQIIFIRKKSFFFSFFNISDLYDPPEHTLARARYLSLRYYRI